MSIQQQQQERRELALRAVNNTLVALNTAGFSLLAGRDYYPADAQELATALRDDITTMVGDIEALRAVILGR